MWYCEVVSGYWLLTQGVRRQAFDLRVVWVRQHNGLTNWDRDRWDAIPIDKNGPPGLKQNSYPPLLVSCHATASIGITWHKKGGESPFEERFFNRLWVTMYLVNRYLTFDRKIWIFSRTVLKLENRLDKFSNPGVLCGVVWLFLTHVSTREGKTKPVKLPKSILVFIFVRSKYMYDLGEKN